VIASAGIVAVVTDDDRLAETAHLRHPLIMSRRRLRVPRPMVPRDDVAIGRVA
jgi:hypothetical protein